MRSKIEAVLKGETKKEIKSFLVDANKEFVTNYTSVYEDFLRVSLMKMVQHYFIVQLEKIELVLQLQLH